MWFWVKWQIPGNAVNSTVPVSIPRGLGGRQASSHIIPEICLQGPFYSALPDFCPLFALL